MPPKEASDGALIVNCQLPASGVSACELLPELAHPQAARIVRQPRNRIQPLMRACPSLSDSASLQVECDCWLLVISPLVMFVTIMLWSLECPLEAKLNRTWSMGIHGVQEGSAADAIGSAFGSETC